MDFWEIYDAHYDPVRRFVLYMVKNEHDAEDIVQEAFFRFNEKKDTIEDDSKTRSWIFRVAHNLCLDHFRRVSARKEEGGAEPDASADAGSSVQMDLERDQMSSCVRDKMTLLSDNDRSVILLCDRMEMSMKEASDVLGIEVGAVKVRLHRARKRLKKILDEACCFEHDERNVLVCVPAKKD